jgi:RimJ/RimL family protein N-acetyltransferase
MWRDPRVVRYTIGTESPPQRTWQRLLAYCGHWLLLGFGCWAVQSKAAGHYIGELGFADFRRSLEPGLEGVPEIGWALAPHAQGQGYATEALREVIAWADAHLHAARTICIIHRGNLASVHLAGKLGYGIELRAASDADPHRVLARDAQR